MAFRQRLPCKFQFTPLREGRPGVSFSCLLWLSISIHAPPRGATPVCGEPPTIYKISIHAPPRGATSAARAVAARNIFQFTPLREGRQLHGNVITNIKQFQFTPLREGRHRYVMVSQWVENISIHAPPRGATPLCDGVAVGGEYFNSRPSARGDAERPADRPRRNHFNSRPSARGDAIDARARSGYAISIHAPPRGATLVNARKSANMTQFQFTPLREGRRVVAMRKEYYQGISIHAPPRGATSWAVAGGENGYFNSRPSARGDDA